MLAPDSPLNPLSPFFSSDRAAERRQGINPDYDALDGEAAAHDATLAVVGVGPGAIAPFIAPPAAATGATTTATATGAPATATDASKYMGGSLARTHLVRGLDYALLARTRDELVGRRGIWGEEDEDKDEDDEEVEAAAAAAAARRAADAAAAAAAMAAVAPDAPRTATGSTPAAAVPAVGPTARTAATPRGRAILGAILPVLSPPPPPLPPGGALLNKPPLPAFAPRRTAWLVDLAPPQPLPPPGGGPDTPAGVVAAAGARGPRPPTTILRSAADCPRSRAAVGGGLDPNALEGLLKILAYVRGGGKAGGRRRQKDAAAALEGGGAPAEAVAPAPAPPTAEPPTAATPPAPAPVPAPGTAALADEDDDIFGGAGREYEPAELAGGPAPGAGDDARAAATAAVGPAAAAAAPHARYFESTADVMADLPPVATGGGRGGGGGGEPAAPAPRLPSGRPAVGDRAGRARPGDPEEEDAYGDLFPGAGFGGAGGDDDSDDERLRGDDVLPVGAEEGEESAKSAKKGSKQWGAKGAKGGAKGDAAATAAAGAPPSKWAARKEEAKLQAELAKIRSLMEEKGTGGQHAAAFGEGGGSGGEAGGSGKKGKAKAKEGEQAPPAERKRRRVLE